jgi:hypothetical protein
MADAMVAQVCDVLDKFASIRRYWGRHYAEYV